MSQTVAAGQCRVQLEVDELQVHWGKPLKGTLTILGGERDQFVPSVSVVLKAQGDADSSGPTSAELDLLSSAVVRSGSIQRIPFQLRTRSELTFYPVELIATISVAFPPDSRSPHAFHRVIQVCKPVRILPGADYLRAVEILSEVSGLRSRRWTPLAEGEGVAAHLAPAPASHEAFEGLQLGWSTWNDASEAQLFVYPRERTLADRLRAMTGANRRVFKIRMEAEPDRMREQFRALLEPFYPRSDDLRRLPIASERMARGPANLPLPSTGPADVEPRD